MTENDVQLMTQRQKHSSVVKHYFHTPLKYRLFHSSQSKWGMFSKLWQTFFRWHHYNLFRVIWSLITLWKH